MLCFYPLKRSLVFCLVVVFNEHDYDYQLFAFHYTYFQISKQGYRKLFYVISISCFSS